MANDPFDSTVNFPSSLDTFPNLTDFGSIASLELPKYHTKLWASNYNKIANFINTTEGLLTSKSPRLANSFTISQPWQVFSLPLLDVLRQCSPWLADNGKAPMNYLPFEVVISSTDLSWKFTTGRVQPESFFVYKTSANLSELFGAINTFQGNLICSAALDLNYETLSNKTAGFQDNFVVSSYITTNNTNTIIIRGCIVDAYMYSDPKPVGTPNGLVVGGSLGTALPTMNNTNWLALGNQRKLTITLMGVQ